MKLDENALIRVLDHLYERALRGMPGSQPVDALVAEYSSGPGTPDERIDRFVRWQMAKCATSGFLTGLGGVMTLPITIPADITANFYVQLRMIAVIARLRGHDPGSDRAKSLAYVCLAGNQAKDALKNAGVQMAQQAARNLLQRMGARSVVSFGRLVPLIGGFVGGAIDGAACKAVGAAAKRLFPAE